MASTPRDLTRLTPAETRAVVDELARLPLKELRRRQGLTESQLRHATTELAARNLQIRQRHLDLAIDQKEFGYEPNGVYGDDYSEYRGLKIEKIAVATQAGYDIARLASRTKKTRQSGTQYVIILEDGGTKTVSTMRAAREYIDNYLGPEQAPNGGYYVWVLRQGSDEPINEGPYLQKDLQGAKTYARISATEGVHDRAVSRGLDPESDSFQIVRRYRAGTGERII